MAICRPFVCVLNSATSTTTLQDGQASFLVTCYCWVLAVCLKTYTHTDSQAPLFETTLALRFDARVHFTPTQHLHSFLAQARSLFLSDEFLSAQQAKPEVAIGPRSICPEPRRLLVLLVHCAFKIVLLVASAWAQILCFVSHQDME